YVFEAMYKMRQPVLANARHKKRFAEMVNNPNFTTLFEGWGIGKDGYGGGTVNHAWSGGGLTIMSSEACGIKPLEPGYKTFSVAPELGNLSFAKTKVPSIRGEIESAITRSADQMIIAFNVPKGTTALFELPLKNYKSILINGIPVDESIEKGKIAVRNPDGQWVVPEGKWEIKISI
ncbi:MAG TPA: alpha-L-rhamnosidase C-terminal domain-containing protein, partial [Sphingobacterium sp.]|nr:alpha-L-rhamnosidase C-terminal domain-containing protein [Sphingobacterium sp.]